MSARRARSRDALAEHRPGHALAARVPRRPRDLRARARGDLAAQLAVRRRLAAGAQRRATSSASSSATTRSSSCATTTGALHALHNTCRHRGMPVCAQRVGQRRALGLPLPPVELRARRHAARLRRHGARDRSRGHGLRPRRRSPRSAGSSSSGPGCRSRSRSATAQAALAAALAPQGLDARPRRPPDRLPRRRQLEARLGEQPRVLALPRRPPASTSRRTSTPRPTRPRRASCAGARAASDARSRARGRAAGQPGADEHAEPGLYALPDRRALVVGQPHAAARRASSPSRSTASRSRR